jgi:hypothetical protein
MLWLTWRQHRSQLLITGGLLAALGTFLLIHGMRNADLTAQFGSDRQVLERVLGPRAEVLSFAHWLVLVPALIGLFWGAPLLGKEYERGTHRLAWAQSVSLRRWLAVKLGVLGAAVALAGLAFSQMIDAWVMTFQGIPRAGRFDNPATFVLTGILPAAWWLFAFVVGVAGGAVFRRTLPAIAATLAVVIVTMMSTFLFHLRDHYATPEQLVLADPTVSAPPNGSFVVRMAQIDADGRELPEIIGIPECVPPDPCETFRQVYYYHPADRYWRFQWTETALLLTGTLALGVLAVHRTVRSRI